MDLPCWIGPLTTAPHWVLLCFSVSHVIAKGPLLPQVRQVSNERAEAESVVGIMQQIHRQGRHAWKDMAILYRTNAQSRLFEEQLVS